MSDLQDEVISSSEAKKHWHATLDHVVDENREVVITRYGTPIAKIVRYTGPSVEQRAFGSLRGTVHVHSDIVESTGEVWDAES